MNSVEKRVRNSRASDLDRTWQRVLDRMVDQVGADEISQLVRPLRPLALTATELRLEAPNKLALVCITDNYLGALRTAVADVIGPRQVQL